MKRRIQLAIAIAFLAWPLVAFAGSYVHGYTRSDGTHVNGYTRGGGSSSRGSYGYGGSSSYAPSQPSTIYHDKGSNAWTTREGSVTLSVPRSRPSDAAAGIARDKHGRIQRSEAAKNEFKREHPCPANGHTEGPCPGYVIDHVKALKHGGEDEPENMQWQTVEQAKAKDRWE